MTAPAEAAAPEGAAQVLADLRRARRRRRIAGFDVGEAVYRVYITAVVGGVAVWLLSGVVGDHRLGAAAAAGAALHGPQVIGAVVGAAWAVGLRSGGRGGPLVLEAADVRHVLLAPVERAEAVRLPALRQLRFGAAAGLAVGAVAGLLAFRRLPGGIAAWIFFGAVVGAATALGGLGLAMVASGRRANRWVAGLAALAVAGWSAADLAEGTTTSPATFLGEIALWPLRFRAAGLIGLAVVAAAVAVGLASVPGVAIEAVERRASLVGQIRFAATLRDLRTVVVLRRQLAQEQSRQRPWVQLPRPAGGRHQRLAVWRRGWHGIARYPAVRLVRMAVLSAGAGAAAVGVWRGTTPLLLAAGGAAYIAALDAVEPLAQEIDHPDRRDAYPEEAGDLHLRLLAAPSVLMGATGLVGVGVAVAVSGGSLTALSAGAVLFVPASLAAVAGAAVSVLQGAPAAFSSTDSLLPPEAAGARAVGRMVIPPALAVIGFLPLLAGRHPGAGITPVAAVGSSLAPVLLVVALAAGWVRYREGARKWFKDAMDEANAARKPAAGGAAGRR